MADAKTKDPKPITAEGDEKTYEVFAAPDDVEYGPYADYQIVPTPQGQFGCPAHHIMTIHSREVWNPKKGRNETQFYSKHRKVVVDDPRTKPSAELTPEEIAQIKEHRAARAGNRVI
jgi:hypothetical protein